MDRLNRELQASPPPPTTDCPWPAGSPVLRYIARLRKPGQPHHAKVRTNQVVVVVVLEEEEEEEEENGAEDVVVVVTEEGEEEAGTTCR